MVFQNPLSERERNYSLYTIFFQIKKKKLRPIKRVVDFLTANIGLKQAPLLQGR